MLKHIFNIHDVVLFMTMAECILLVIFQTILPVKKPLAHRLLTVFFLSIAISSACVLVMWNGEVGLAPFFDEILLPYCLVIAQLVKGPALLFYVASLTQDAFRFTRRHAIHAVPCIAGLGWLYFFQLDSSELSFRNPNRTAVEHEIINSIWHFIKIIPLLYAIAAVNNVRLYVINLKNHYSTFSTIEPGWLNILSIGFLASWGFCVVVHVLANTVVRNYPGISEMLGIAENYIIFILINALFIYSLVYAHQLLTTKTEPGKDKQDEKLTDIAIAKVQQGMQIEKLFLKQNLNIDEFSKRIQLPVREVSAVINRHYDTNFFEFMNRYRIEEAKRLLGDPLHNNMTVMDILLQSGFNSKSAFHRFFNRLVGMSPTQYRNQKNK